MAMACFAAFAIGWIVGWLWDERNNR